MMKNRNLYGITTLIVIILSLFLLIFATSYYLNAQYYQQLSSTRLTLLQEQVNAENQAEKFLKQAQLAIENDEIAQFIEDNNLELNSGYYNYDIIINDKLTLHLEFELSNQVKLVKEYYE